MIIKTFILFIALFLPAENSLDSFLSDYFAEYESFKYEIVSTPKNLTDISEAAFVKDAEPTYRNGYMYIPVEVPDNNGSVRSFITLKMELFKEVAVAGKTVHPRKDLTKTEFIIEIRNVAGLKSNDFPDINNITEYRARTTIREGDVLQDYMIEKKPDVGLNDPLEARLVKGTIEIKIDARARQEGSIGDVIRVESSDRKYFSAKIETVNKVLIIE